MRGRIDPETVTAIARDAAGSGRIIAVRATGTGDDEAMAAPWDQPPSGRMPAPALTGIALPDTVKAVFAQRLLIDKAGLPLPLSLAQLSEHVVDIVILHGGMSAKQRREATHQLANSSNSSGHLVAATGRYIGEGFDDPSLDTLLRGFRAGLPKPAEFKRYQTRKGDEELQITVFPSAREDIQRDHSNN